MAPVAPTAAVSIPAKLVINGATFPTTFPIPELTVPRALKVVPKAPATLPNTTKAGPAAAATKPHFIIWSCCSSLKLVNHSVNSPTLSASCSIYGAKRSLTVIAAVSNLPFKFSIDPVRPLFIVSAISLAAPFEFCNPETTPSNSGPALSKSANIPLKDSFPNNVFNALFRCSSDKPLKRSWRCGSNSLIGFICPSEL